MANIAFITSRYLPNPDANGICVNQVSKHLKSIGHHVICVCEGEEKQPKYEVLEGVEVFRVRRTFFSKQLHKSAVISGKPRPLLNLLLFLRRVRSLLLLPIFPNTEPFRTRKIVKLVDSLIHQKSIDCVIGVFRPFDGVAAALKLKKKHPSKSFGGYYLDLMKGATIPSFLSRKSYNLLCDRKEQRVFKRLDFILMAEAGKSTYDSKYFGVVKHKIHYVSFPVFRDIRKEPHENISYDEGYYNIVYAGYLDKNYRNPEFFFGIVDYLCRSGCKIKMHIYGRNNCYDLINRYCMSNPNAFHYYGIVSLEHARGAILSSNAVLNISNKSDNIVPSKIFELFSSCKPIINVVTNPNDISQQYFRSYPAVCSVEEYNGKMSTEAHKLRDFIDNYRHYSADYAHLTSVYYKNTPIATVSVLARYLTEKSDAR